jgi:hypothetical protein
MYRKEKGRILESLPPTRGEPMYRKEKGRMLESVMT